MSVPCRVGGVQTWKLIVGTNEACSAMNTVASRGTGEGWEPQHGGGDPFFAFMESVPDAMVVVDATGVVQAVNRHAERLFDYAKGALVGASVECLMPLEFRENHQQHVVAHAKDPRYRPLRAGLELYGLSRTGRRFPVEISLSPFERAEGLLIVATIRDVSERKSVERALRDSEAMWRSLVEHAPDFIATIQRDGTIGFANRSMGGMAVAELEGSSFYALLAPPYHDIARHCVKRVFESGGSTGCEVRGGEGLGNAWYSCRFGGVSQRETVEAAIVICTDISNRKRAEQALDERNASLHLLQVITSAANEAYTSEEAMVIVLREMCAFMCWPVGHACMVETGPDRACAPTVLWHVEDEEKWSPLRAACEYPGAEVDNELWTRVLETGQPTWQTLIAVEMGEGVLGTAQALGIQLALALPVLVGSRTAAVLTFYSTSWSPPEEPLLDLMRPVSIQLGRVLERERAAAALAASEAKYQDLYNQAPDLFASVEIGSGKLVRCNQRFCDVTGFDREALMNRPVYEVLHPASLEQAKRMFDQIVEQGEVRDVELTLRGRDGAELDVSVSATAVRDRKGQVRYSRSVWRDITERKRAERALEEARESLESSVALRTGELEQEVLDRKQAETELRDERNKAQQYLKQLRSLASEVSMAEERERRRIAGELHDHIGQNLAMTNVKLGQLRAAGPAPDMIGVVDEARQLLLQAIAQTRSLTFELTSPLLYQLGLAAAIEDLCQRMERDYGIAIYFRDDHRPKPLRREVEVVLFRAVRELLCNIRKHAGAKAAEIALLRKGAFVEVNVEDDGVGFDATEVGMGFSRTGGFGLFNLRERLDHVGGRLRILSNEGDGTCIALTVPIAQEEDMEEKDGWKSR